MGNYVKVTGKWLFSLCKPINEKRNMIPAIEKGLKAVFSRGVSTLNRLNSMS